VEIVATHQQHIALIITQILALSDDTLTAFSRGNPFDKLLRSYDEFAADGKGLYRKKLGSSHYRYSKSAYSSGLSADKLFGEHRIPLKLISQQLMNSDRKLSTVELILRSNEVVLITDEEERQINASKIKGGFALRSVMAPNGGCRLAYCGIEIAPEILPNHL
jgi:hypothetical protein